MQTVNGTKYHVSNHPEAVKEEDITKQYREVTPRKPKAKTAKPAKSQKTAA